MEKKKKQPWHHLLESLPFYVSKIEGWFCDVSIVSNGMVDYHRLPGIFTDHHRLLESTLTSFIRIVTFSPMCTPTWSIKSQLSTVARAWFSCVDYSFLWFC